MIKRKKSRLSLSILILSLSVLNGCFRHIAPEGIGPTDLEEGLIAYDQGRWEKAIQHLDQAIKNYPENTEALFKRGNISQRLEKIDDAISSYREVVRIDKNHFKAHYNLANLYSYEKADTVQAVFHYRRFLSISPNHPLARKAQNKLKQLTKIPGEHRNSQHVATFSELVEETAPLAGQLVQPPISPLPPSIASPSIKPLNRGVFPQVVCISGMQGQKKVEGSGFIVGDKGYILASRHQVDRATHLMARFQDGTAYPATLLSISETLDLALLQIPFQGMTPLLFDLQQSPSVGDSVLAIGCPFGLNHSASKGIISAPERIFDQKPLLQTDVAVNPGSSGGPLLNREGAVLGVIIGVLPKAQGISFALPARDARHFLGETFLQIGTLYAEAKRYDEAARALRMSSEFRPDSAQTLNNLGEVYRRLKQYETAETVYLRAILSQPSYADAHYNLGILYDNHLKNKKQAVIHYKRYLALNPASRDAALVGQWLALAESKE